MANSNQKIVDKFFEAYSKHDMKGIGEVMHEDVKWFFIGQHPFAGIKNGIDELVSFFDTMGKMMGDSKPDIEKLIVCENENYFIETSHIKTNRKDGINVDHQATVLWTIRGGKIIEGRHFFADPVALDHYFTRVSGAVK